jgi:ribulose-bisphosphate carboxylase large chain
MEGNAEDTMIVVDALRWAKTPANPKMETLGQDWYGMKNVVSVASGGLYPGAIPKVIKTMGKDIVCQMGGGVHGHPCGTSCGATAVVEAVEASMKGVPLKTYAKKHEMLDKAVKKWGVA